MKQEIFTQVSTTPLSLAVAAAGVLVFVLGVFGAFRPASLTALVERLCLSPRGAGLVLVFRASLGILLIAAASGTLYPKTLIVIGALTLAKAMIIPLLGRTRQQNLIKWWCLQPARYIRDWSLIACVFGVFFTCAAMSDHDASSVATTNSERFMVAQGECRNARSTILYLLLSKTNR